MECAAFGVQGKCCNEEWLFHSKELQRSHVPRKSHDLPPL